MDVHLNMKHEERRIIKHTPNNLFNLVADVKKYPEFLPWCLGARIKNTTLKSFEADLIICLGTHLSIPHTTTLYEDYAVQAKKIVIGTPYLDEINAREEEFFLSKGFEILRMEGLNLETGIEFGKVTPDFWNKFSLEIDCEDADAVFLSCTGIRSLDIIEKVEAQINKPVITSNQAQMWSALRLAGINDNLKGFGKLFGY